MTGLSSLLLLFRAKFFCYFSFFAPALWFCDWNRHHEERQVEDAVLCVLLIVAVGNRPLIGCFLAESPLCCACDTTHVTSVFFRSLPSLLIFAAQNFWTSLWRPVLSTRQGQQRVMIVQKLCESVASSANRRSMRQKTGPSSKRSSWWVTIK